MTTSPALVPARKPVPVRLPKPLSAVSTFDPALPEDGALVVAEVLRNQFTGLQSLIQAVPTITGAVVDAVNTLPAGSPAQVSASISGDVLHLSFGIPTGDTGAPGPQGEPGPVNFGDLASAIQTTSTNSNQVSTLNQQADGYYNSSQLQQVMDKVDELINALRRW